MMLHRTVYISVDVDVDWAMLVRIPFNGSVKRVTGGVVCTGGLASEGVWSIWYRT